MKGSRIQDLYQRYYADLGFERAGLFQAIRKRYGCREALYPGSLVHITPSFYFPHVVYVDQSAIAAAFFADTPGLLDYINRHKTYQQSPYIRFFGIDYTERLPLRQEAFDLLISLYAGGIALACKRYLRRGGLLLTNNHHNDAAEAVLDGGYRLISAVQYRTHAYSLQEDNLDRLLVSAEKRAGRKAYLRRTSRGVAYSESEDYFVFARD